MIPEALKDIPGYKAILKAVLRQQIQQLVEQLSEQTGEETVVLSANISDGTLSHLGSEYGKVFLREEQTIKSKFLGFCLKRNLNNQSESPQDTDGREWSVPQLKRKTLNSDICVGSSAKVSKLSDSELSNARISHNQLDTDIMKCLPDLSRATSNYMLKLNQTVGQEVMKDSDNDVTNQFQTELPSNMAAESDIDFTRHNRTDIDLSIVKIEKQSESNEKENRKSDSRFNKFGASPNLPQFEAYSGSWTKNPTAGGSNPELLSLSNHSTGLWGNSHNSPNIQGGQFTNSDWPELNAVNNNLLIQRKEYKCEFCDKIFREKTNLRVHVRTHTGEKPFRCLLCGKEFAHSSNLKQHERGVHKLPPTVPQYKQQFYTGLTKMYGMTNVKPSESSNSLSENQPLLSGYHNIQSFQQNQNNEDIKSLPNSIEFDSENQNKDNVFSQSQAVFPTNGDCGFVNRIKVECEDTNDSVIDDTGTPSQFSSKSTDNENETSEVENLL